MPIATADDVVARLGRPFADEAEATKAAAFIEDAIALIDDYCGTDFQQHTDEAFGLVVEGGRARLAPSVFPNLTISSVILHEDTGDLDLTSDEWAVRGSNLYVLTACEYTTATVTASWGWVAVPGSVRAAVCSEVIRWLSVSPGTVMEKTGDLQVEYAQTAYNSGLSEAAKSMLSKYRKPLGSISLTRNC
jgi:hypothetical protein